MPGRVAAERRRADGARFAQTRARAMPRRTRPGRAAPPGGPAQAARHRRSRAVSALTARRAAVQAAERVECRFDRRFQRRVRFAAERGARAIRPSLARRRGDAPTDGRHPRARSTRARPPPRRRAGVAPFPRGSHPCGSAGVAANPRAARADPLRRGHRRLPGRVREARPRARARAAEGVCRPARYVGHDARGPAREPALPGGVRGAGRRARRVCRRAARAGYRSTSPPASRYALGVSPVHLRNARVKFAGSLNCSRSAIVFRSRSDARSSRRASRSRASSTSAR